jgi:hypothetical protein
MKWSAYAIYVLLVVLAGGLLYVQKAELQVISAKQGLVETQKFEQEITDQQRAIVSLKNELREHEQQLKAQQEGERQIEETTKAYLQSLDTSPPPRQQTQQQSYAEPRESYSYVLNLPPLNQQAQQYSAPADQTQSGYEYPYFRQPYYNTYYNPYGDYGVVYGGPYYYSWAHDGDWRLRNRDGERVFGSFSNRPVVVGQAPRRRSR